MNRYRFQLDTFLYVASGECLYWQSVTGPITWQTVLGGVGIGLGLWKAKRSTGVDQKNEVNSQP